ncbi:spore peptidoglycan hydrolase (N-acetylglucosaminidase) [Minicystis rosea]|nr:spore peptidoglycan hydrolase (N-acetylglucosaminidase) [Minicystis rosea]
MRPPRHQSSLAWAGSFGSVATPHDGSSSAPLDRRDRRARACDRTDDPASLPPAAFPITEPAAEHRFCGWLYGSRDPLVMNRAYDTFAEHAADFDAVHPTWFHVSAPTRITPRAVGVDDPRVLAHTTRGGARTRLIPTIQAEDRPDRDYAHTMIHDPTLRRRHVEAIVALVAEGHYDGIDLDYEHLADTLGEGQSLADEGRAFSAFVTEVAAALHAEGKTLSLAVPAESGPSEVYDYEALAAAADQVHVMGYDYHWEGGPHLGPVAPLGWIRGVVSYIGTIDGGHRRNQFLLGVPNYGLVGAGATLCSPTTACLALAGTDYRTTTSHACSMGDLEAGRAPNQTLPDGREMFFDDIASLEEKVDVAAQGGLGGIAYWSIGGEPDRPGPRSFFEMVRYRYPRADVPL